MEDGGKGGWRGGGGWRMEGGRGRGTEGWVEGGVGGGEVEGGGVDF